MPSKTTNRISERTITAVADRALEEWARNVLHDGDDLGYNHISPEQKMVIGYSGYQEPISGEEELVMGYMISLSKDEEMMHKVGKLHYIERNWWKSGVRRKGHWLRPERGRNPQQKPARMKSTMLHYIGQSAWMNKLRDSGFKHNRVGHRPNRLVLGDGETVITEKPKNELWLAYIEQVHDISRSEYYRKLSTLRHRVYYLLN